VVETRELGPLEMRVLGLLQGAAPMPVHAIQAELEQGGSPLAYTTVMTVLVRLHEKGLLVRHKEGRRFLYSTAGRTSAAKHGLLARIQGTLFAKDRAQPILSLLDDDSLSPADLRALRKKIDEKLKAKS
jgi:predicted transcriptional regulator